MRKIIMCMILIVLGVGFSIWGYGVMRKARASLEWPVKQGTVLKSEVRSTSTSGQSGYQHSANIQYKYTVNNKTYSSDKVIAGSYSSNSARSAEKLTRQYKKGSNVKVYYDPERPDNAVLVPGGTILIYVPLGFGIIATASGIAALLLRKKALPESGYKS
jgi:hypothetical protein